MAAELLITAGWERIEAAQHGMADTRQLAELGVTRDMIVAQIDAGRWQWVLPRTYATFTGPLSRNAEIVAALLYGGPAAVLSHRTAAERWGMVPVAPDGPVHITLPYGTSAISQPPLVVVHRSRAFRHIVVALDPPVTSPADTAIDMAAAEPDVRSAQRTLTGVIVSGRVRPVEVEARLIERPPRRYRRAMAATVALVRNGVQSVLEECYATDVELAHGRRSRHSGDPFSFAHGPGRPPDISPPWSSPSTRTA